MIFKLSAAILIFLAAVMGGLWPILTKSHKQSYRLLTYGEYFARGLFLATGLIHLLGEAEKTFLTTYPHVSYPFILTLCVITIFALTFIEQSARKLAHAQSAAHLWLAYLLLILLSIHSIIEGAVLGINLPKSDLILIFIAIFSHKSAAAFALGINMRTHHVSKNAMLWFLILFALMTPFGILLSSMLSELAAPHDHTLPQVLFSAIAAGTFIYLALCKTISFEQERPLEILPTLFFGLGIAIMSCVAILE